jgi:multicomponent Na+:H+ antiporter subunit E
MRLRVTAGRFALAVWLVVLWELLWRDLSVANTVSGVVVAVLVALVSPPLPRAVPRHRVRPLALLRFLGYFVWLLVVSNLVVALEILTRRDRIRSGIVAVPLAGSSDLATTVLADAITLTPGTLSLEVRHGPPTLYVHVLHVRDVESVRRDIHRLQRMVVRAIGSADAVHDLDAADVGPLPPSTAGRNA